MRYILILLGYIIFLLLCEAPFHLAIILAFPLSFITFLLTGKPANTENSPNIISQNKEDSKKDFDEMIIMKSTPKFRTIPIPQYKDTRSSKAIELGNIGEELVVKELSKLNDYGEYTMLNDIRLGNINSPTQIDHILISKFGVFVIETKNYSGTVQGHTNEEYWVVKYPNGSVVNLYNPIKQNADHITSVKIFAHNIIQGLQFNDTNIHSVIVFTNRSSLKILGTLKTRGAILQLNSLINYITQFDKIVFSENEVNHIINNLSEHNLTGREYIKF